MAELTVTDRTKIASKDVIVTVAAKVAAAGVTEPVLTRKQQIEH